MRQFGWPFRRGRYHRCAAAVVATQCLVTPAMAETRFGVDLSLSGKVSTNAFEEPNSPSTAAAEVEISPWVKFLNSTTSVELSGDVSVDQYTKQFGTETAAGARISAEKLVSPALTLSAGGGFKTSRAGGRQGFLDTGSAPDFVPPPTTPLPDISFAGLTTRSKLLNGNVGASLKTGPSTELALNFGAALSRYGSLNGADYDSFSSSLSYSRKLSDRTSLKANMLVSRANYLGRSIGDGAIISPTVSVERRLSDTLKLSLNAGVSLSRTHLPTGASKSVASLSGLVRLCSTRERSVLCLNAARTAQPTAIGGISTVSQVSVAWHTQIGPRDRISLSGRYAQTNRSLTGAGNNSRAFGAQAEMTHEFDKKLSAYLAPSFSRFSDRFGSRKPNFQLQLGVHFRFGEKS